jgi:hypothetical protein
VGVERGPLGFHLRLETRRGSIFQNLKKNEDDDELTLCIGVSHFRWPLSSVEIQRPHDVEKPDQGSMIVGCIMRLFRGMLEVVVWMMEHLDVCVGILRISTDGVTPCGG